MSWIEYLLLIIVVIASGIAAFLFKDKNRKLLDLMFTLSGAYVLGVILLHMMPGVFQSGISNIGIYVFIGFILQLLLEQLSLGVEHGHIHDHFHESKNMFIFKVLIALSLHGFVEGFPLSGYGSLLNDGHAHHTNHYFWGLLVHKSTESFALGLMLFMSNFKRNTIIITLLVFSITTPLGTYCGSLLAGNLEIFNKIVAVAVGSLLHISTMIIYEVDNSDAHHKSWKKIAAIVAGIGLSLLTL
jgi:zinc transporter ZupT